MNALTPQRKLKHDKGGRYSRLDHRRSIGAATKMTGEVAGEVAVPWRGVEVAETNKGFKAMYLSMKKKIKRREKNFYQQIHPPTLSTQSLELESPCYRDGPLATSKAVDFCFGLVSFPNRLARALEQGHPWRTCLWRGGFFSSVDAGSCPREVEASAALTSSVGDRSSTAVKGVGSREASISGESMVGVTGGVSKGGVVGAAAFVRAAAELLRDHWVSQMGLGPCL
ncbi:hypothetical protein HID58_003072 [Brassica napus]|uniref:Uncharacterized protein n=1 Tax=Brassica napus TaxID=3708 RepID=A0ABQ8ES57_BRANA|nr:hypothetical protein HID58_004016 [Brassica napus]KAH0943435.1 hypothetical protein HID58_003072 [Brassica napus]